MKRKTHSRHHPTTLGASHSKKLGTRGFDVLHVAAAITHNTKTFITFDVRQKSLAAKAGLNVKP